MANQSDYWGRIEAENFINDINGNVSAISAEIDRSQTRRAEAERWSRSGNYTIGFERAYENRLREEIQNG